MCTCVVNTVLFLCFLEILKNATHCLSVCMGLLFYFWTIFLFNFATIMLPINSTT